MNLTLTPAQFGTLLTTIAVTLPLAQRHALELSGQIVEDEAKALIGTYDYDPQWPELAESTKRDRVAQGYSENEPGLRSGEMQESIHHEVRGDTVHIGSDDDKLVWFELGTVKQPSRTVLKGAMLNSIEEIEHITGRTVHAHISSGRYPSSAGHPFNHSHETIK